MKKLELLKLSFVAIIIGIVVGILDTLFGKISNKICGFREEHFVFLIPFLAIAGLIIIFVYSKWGKKAGRGMGLVFDVGHGDEKEIPIILIPIAIFTTWITHLFGGSAGREGVAMQIGATVGNRLGNPLKSEESRHMLLIAGMAAGFSGMFQTPIAAVFLAMEVLTVGVLEIETLLPTLLASYAAYETSSLLGLEKFTVQISKMPWDWNMSWKLVILAVLFGIVGSGFAYLLRWTKKKMSDYIDNPYWRIVIGGVALSILSLVCYMGRYSGIGSNLISLSFNGGEIYYWDFIAKLLFTVLTLSVGYQGGEVTPLFAIGASLGAVIGPLFGIPSVFAAALGYVAVFGGGSNTFIAPVVIGCEVFGYENLPYFFVVCAISYVVNRNQTIYVGQKTLKDKNRLR